MPACASHIALAVGYWLMAIGYWLLYVRDFSVFLTRMMELTNLPIKGSGLNISIPISA